MAIINQKTNYNKLFYIIIYVGEIPIYKNTHVGYMSRIHHEIINLV